MIERVEQYGDDLKVLMTPTKTLPNGGYFYASADARELVESKRWLILCHTSGFRVRNSSSIDSGVFFHVAYMQQQLNVDSLDGVVDHMNGVPFDNVSGNLRVATTEQNSMNKVTRGYTYVEASHGFVPYITVHGQMIRGATAENEITAAQMAYDLHKEYFGEWDYDFFNDRRTEYELLDKERTHKISHDEAVYEHVKSHVERNAWYVYRYNLQDYCKEYHIQIPEFRFDANGFLVDKDTGIRLCPIREERCVPVNKEMTKYYNGFITEEDALKKRYIQYLSVFIDPALIPDNLDYMKRMVMLTLEPFLGSADVLDFLWRLRFVLEYGLEVNKCLSVKLMALLDLEFALDFLRENRPDIPWVSDDVDFLEFFTKDIPDIKLTKEETDELLVALLKWAIKQKKIEDARAAKEAETLRMKQWAKQAVQAYLEETDSS